MNLIRRVVALTAAAAITALVPLTVGACGSASAPTNGLEHKSPADVLQQAAATLKAAPSVHLVGGGPSGQVNVRLRRDARTGTITLTGTITFTGTITREGHEVKVTIIGSNGYINTDIAGLEKFGVPPEVAREIAGRWLKLPVSESDLKGISLADLASRLTAYHAPLDPKVRQATLDGKPVLVVSWRDGSKLYVANTGPAYPLRAELKTGPDAGRVDFTEYSAHFQITAPANVINISGSG